MDLIITFTQLLAVPRNFEPRTNPTPETVVVHQRRGPIVNMNNVEIDIQHPNKGQRKIKIS